MNLRLFIPITRQQEFRPPPPPVTPKITDVLNVVEDDVKINDELIINDAESDQQMQVDINEFTGAGEEVADEEIKALRVVMSSPKWEPGRQRGKPVKVQFTFPINFVL